MWRLNSRNGTLITLLMLSVYLILGTVTVSDEHRDLQKGSDLEVKQKNSLDDKKDEGRNYTISIWKVGERLKRRFLRSFGTQKKDPFQFCPVRNCRLETDDRKVANSDAVMFHMHLIKGPHDVPDNHPSHQLWIFFTDESPHHTFMATRNYSMKDFNGIFNLSMTYRSDSDIPVPYGRTEQLMGKEATSGEATDGKNYEETVRGKTKLVTILGSNCGGKNKRWEYVKQLQKHINVDVFGGCGKKQCPGHFTKDCDVIKDYKFYLSFENSNCAEYITEKLWYNAFLKYSVPIVMGASKKEYTKLCPPNSFIHVDDYESPEHLAAHISRLSESPEELLAYHAWRRHYRVLNEHGYFGTPSLHLCRMCEAVQKQWPSPKICDRLEDWWSVKKDCRKSII